MTPNNDSVYIYIYIVRRIIGWEYFIMTVITKWEYLIISKIMIPSLFNGLAVVQIFGNQSLRGNEHGNVQGHVIS